MSAASSSRCSAALQPRGRLHWTDEVIE